MQKIKKVTWYTPKDGKVNDVAVTREGEKPLPENKDWKISLYENVLIEDSLDWYEIDNEGVLLRKVSDEEYLLRQGREDPRSTYHHKGREKQDVTINNIDSAPPGDDYTKEEPLPDEPYQKFNEKKGKWEVDTQKKERAEKEKKLAELKSQADFLERKADRPMREKELGIDVEESVKRIRHVQNEIEKLRPEIKALENELESA